MDVLELKKLYDSSVCNLAMYLDCCIRMELEKVVGNDDVMQDHWAAAEFSVMRNRNDVKDCLEFLHNAGNAINDAVAQEEAFEKHFKTFEVEPPLIAKMLMGHIGFKVDKKLVECSRMVKITAGEILSKKKKKMSKVERENLVREFMGVVIPMTEKYGIHLTYDGGSLDLNGMYLEAWFMNKCMAD
ncbi:hypothetical protein L6468_11400 [Prevotella communis]|uniref:hypothetical protein n=1 Tax=Prevotella communis TaxID=2913614 RepID=UPI001EDB0CF6|nr:hypothetical protein [Prevotella communis]UKK61583.1 hypothetical protein L6468_11400 [Prevotella communis]UKK64409.1 hypothetical protein L6473_11405 [Prevotella communis]